MSQRGLTPWCTLRIERKALEKFIQRVKVSISYRFLSVHELNTRKEIYLRERKLFLMYWITRGTHPPRYPGYGAHPTYPSQDLQDLFPILNILGLG